MNSRDFCYWLQGFFELNGPTRTTKGMSLTAEQTECVMNHLALVFQHEIDPSFGDNKSQEILNKIHSGEAIRC